MLGAPYCPAHRKAVETSELYAKKRDPKYGTKRWQGFSRLVRACNPICQMIRPNGEQCHAASTNVHHVFPVEKYPQWQFSIYTPSGQQNLVALCDHCHSPALTSANFVPTKLPKFKVA